MRRIGRPFLVAIGLFTIVSLAEAGSHTSRTYFGGPGTGPYGPVVRYRHPWTAKICGIRCCQTPEEQYERMREKYLIADARYQTELNRLNHEAECLRHHVLGAGVASNMIGKCSCGAHGGFVPPAAGHCQTPCAKCGFPSLFKGHGCGKCGKCSKCATGCPTGDCGTVAATESAPPIQAAGAVAAPCGMCRGAGCPACGGHGFKRGMGGAGAGDGNMGPARSTPPYMHPGYPLMNREDAVRYIEGFQYYPPYQLIRSPRDFYMFDAKYGIGRQP